MFSKVNNEKNIIVILSVKIINEEPLGEGNNQNMWKMQVKLFP